MAEYREVTKQFNRMCESYGDTCENCLLQNPRGILTCWRWCFEEPVKAEKIIMDWAKENPVVTNRDKFKEVFGIDWWAINTADWLKDEYKEPEKDD